MKIITVNSQFLDTVLVVYDPGVDISFSFEVTVFLSGKIFFIISFDPFFPSGTNIIVLFFFAHIPQDRTQHIFQRKSPALTVFNDIQSVEYFYTGTCFDGLKDIKFPEFVCKGFELHGMSCIDLAGEYNIPFDLFAFFVFEFFAYRFCRDTAVNTEQFNKNFFFPGIDTGSTDHCLIGFLRRTECIVVCRDDTAAERPVMDNGIVTRNASVTCDGFEHREEKNDNSNRYEYEKTGDLVFSLMNCFICIF